MAIELLSPIVIAGAAILFISPGEGCFRTTGAKKVFRDGFWTDLIWYTFVQSYVLALVISMIIRRIDSGTGFSRLHIVE